MIDNAYDNKYYTKYYWLSSFVQVYIAGGG